MTEANWEIEGTWEDVRGHDAELAGRRVRLTVLDNGGARNTRENGRLSALLTASERMTEGIASRPGADSVRLVRDAREGRLYGLASDE